MVLTQSQATDREKAGMLMGNRFTLPLHLLCFLWPFLAKPNRSWGFSEPCSLQGVGSLLALSADP